MGSFLHKLPELVRESGSPRTKIDQIFSQLWKVLSLKTKLANDVIVIFEIQLHELKTTICGRNACDGSMY